MLKAKSLMLLAMMVLLISVSAVVAQDGTIVDVASGDEHLSTFVELVNAAGLAEAWAAEGSFTVFAPNNEAFANLPSFVFEYLNSNHETLTRVLNYHVLPTSAMAADMSTMTASTVEGGELSVVVTEAGITVDGANVISTDISASNGVIHVIDTVLFPAFELPEVDPLAVSDNIIAAGSSTVYPVTERMADLFDQDGFAGTITVDSIGSGAGLERFCVNAETDIANASRPINEVEAAACESKGLIPAEFYVGIDALAIVVSTSNNFLTGLTTEQLAQIFSGEVTTWNQIDASYPTETIQLFSPGSDSGTYDYFVEEIFDEDETLIQNAPGIQFSEDDNVLVAGVEGSPYAIAYFGFAYYQENRDKLKALTINGIEPNEQTGASGEYPLSRPLFIYSAPSILQARPQVAAFVNYYLQNANAELGTGADQIGYIPTPQAVQNRNALYWLAASGM